MPKVKELPATEAEHPKLPEFLEDGHPNHEAMDVWQFMQALDNQNLWDHYVAYLFRVEPKRAGDKNPNIGCFSSSLSLEQVRRVYGGRKFTLILNRKVGTKQPTVYKVQFDIEAPPIYQDNEDDRIGRTPGKSGESAGDGNAKADPLLTKLVDDLIEQRDQMLQRGETFDTGAALQNAISLQNEGFKAALSSIAANAGKQNGDGGMLGLVMTMMMKQSEQTNAMILKMIETNGGGSKKDGLTETLLNRLIEAKTADPFDSISKTIGVIDSLRGIKSGGGSGKITLEDVGMTFVKSLPEIMDKGIEIVNGLSQAKSPATQAGRQPARSPVPIRAAGLPPAAAQTPPANPNPAKPVAGINSNATALTPEQQANAILMHRIKEMLVEKLLAGESGSSAALVADSIFPAFAKYLAELFAKAETDEAARAELQKDFILNEAFEKSTLPEIIAFCRDYVEYWSAEPEGGEELPPDAGPENNSASEASTAAV